MSHNSTGTFRDTTSVDYLNEVRKEQAANKFGKTSDDSNTPHTVAPFAEDLEIDDDVAVDGNLNSFSDSIDAEDDAFFYELGTGIFVVGADNNDRYLYGYKLIGDGSTVKAIVKRAKLQPTAALTLAVRAKLIAFTGTIRELIHNQNANNGYRVYAEASANNIVVEWYSGSALISSQTFAFTADTRFTLVASFQSGNQDLYKDGSLSDSDTVAATMTASSTDVGYGGQATGSEYIISGDELDNLVIIDRYVNAAWVTKYNGGWAQLDQATDLLVGIANFCDCAA